MVKTMKHGDALVIKAGKKSIHILVFDEATIVLADCECEEYEE